MHGTQAQTREYREEHAMQGFVEAAMDHARWVDRTAEGDVLDALAALDRALHRLEGKAAERDAHVIDLASHGCNVDHVHARNAELVRKGQRYRRVRTSLERAHEVCHG